jgi:uncharacterized protein (DUF488 family)
MALRPPSTLWTVGHSTHPLGEFLDILHAHGITRIADVRRFPGSRAYPHFNPEQLERSLAESGISYTPMPTLGGRRKPRADSQHHAWHNDSFRGYADYMDTAEFAVAADELAALARDDRVAAMCAEGVWWRCHRSMIADYFKANGWEVLHIMGAGEAKEHPYTAVARVENGTLMY